MITIELSLSDIAAIIKKGSDYVYIGDKESVTLRLDTEDLECGRKDYDQILLTIKDEIYERN